MWPNVLIIFIAYWMNHEILAVPPLLYVANFIFNQLTTLQVSAHFQTWTTE